MKMTPEQSQTRHRRPEKAAWFYLVAVPIMAMASNADASEARVWSAAEVRYSLTDQLRLSLEQHLRFDNGISRVASVMPEVSLTVRWDWFRLAAGYRFEYERDNDGVFAHGHRLHADGQLRVRLQPFVFSYRLRFQESIRPEREDRHTVRNRLKIALDLDTWIQPYVSAELFTRFGNDEGWRLRKWRATAGVAFEVGDHEIAVAYRTELPLEDEDDPVLHIACLSYEFDLPLPGIN